MANAYINYISITMPNSEYQQEQKPDSEKPAELWQEFAISRFHLFRHIVAFILTILLCFSLFMATLTSYIQKHESIHINQMTLVYILFLSFVLIIAVTAIISVRKVRINKESIELSNLLWHEKVNWSDLQSVYGPAGFKYVCFKTKYFLYLLIKNEFKNYSQLEYLLGQHIDIKN